MPFPELLYISFSVALFVVLGIQKDSMLTIQETRQLWDREIAHTAEPKYE